MKTINVTFTDEEIQALKETKGERTWRKAVLTEFGVDD